MASISIDGAKRVRIQFSHPNRSKKSLRLGAIAEGRAVAIKGRVEQMVAALKAGVPYEPEMQRWLDNCDDKLHARLAAVGLVAGREKPAVVTVKGFIDDFTKRRVDVKPATKEIWRFTAANLYEHFGPDCDVLSITEAKALDFKQFLIDSKLAPTTIAKRLQQVRSFFHDARRRGIIRTNPFAEVSAKSIIRLDQRRFVTEAETRLVLGACPDHHWRTIVGLARFAGLRCPSEVLSLRWQDIDWENQRITVQSPKTECHGKATRSIPMFPRLRPILEQAFELAPEGALYVVDDRFRKCLRGTPGWRNCNQRSTFQKIIRRAGLEPWPKLFHALRSSCETDLAAEFPIHVVTAWLGNTPAIALRHYLLVTESDFERAVGKSSKEASSEESPSSQKSAAPKAAPQDQDLARAGSQPILTNLGFSEENDGARVGASAENWGTRIRT